MTPPSSRPSFIDERLLATRERAFEKHGGDHTEAETDGDVDPTARHEHRRELAALKARSRRG